MVFDGAPIAFTSAHGRNSLEDLPREAREIAWNVLRHLSRNLDARDTVEGILNWWLPPKGEWTREQVREVLEYLASRLLLSVRGERLETRVYGLDRAHIEEMQQLFAELDRER
jgi:hypothetical protein